MMRKNAYKILTLFALSVISCSSIVFNKNKETLNKISLKNNFKDSFYIGSALNQDQILGQDKKSLKIVKNQFNTITPENCMKWLLLEPEQGNFDFTLADKFVNFGLENKMHIVGHTLVWHSQLPDFVKKTTNADILNERIKNHINLVVKRYKGKINTWDVVNEALNEDGSYRESIFFNLLGENFIEDAFSLAAKADPEAELVYNDYNLCKESKRNGAVRLIQNLKGKNIKVDGVGIQAHWQLTTPSLKKIEESIIAFSELGVKVMFTELDISVLPSPWDLQGAEISQNFKEFEGDKKMNPYPDKLPDSIQNQLAKRYEDIMKLFLKHQDKISRVTFWGVTDKNSWLNDWPIKGRTNYPLLFDKNYKYKKAYHSILNLKN